MFYFLSNKKTNIFILGLNKVKNKLNYDEFVRKKR